MDCKRSRKCFSIEEKLHLLKKLDNHHGTRVVLAKTLGISVSTLNTIAKNKRKISEVANETGSYNKKRKYARYSKYKELEEIMKNWFQTTRAANIPVSGVVLREKAMQVANRMGIVDFSASNGWLDRFKNRFNLKYKTVCGESNAVSSEDVRYWQSLRSTSVDEVPKAELTVTSHNESSNEMVAEAERDTSSHNFDNANLHSSIEIKEESEVRTELDISESTIKAEPFSPHSQHEEIFNLPSSTPPLSTEFGHHSNFEHKVDILDWSSPAEQYIQTSPNQLHIKDNVRRIVDIGFLFNQLRNISRHKQKNSCTFADMTLINEERNGFMSTFIFECSKCHLKSNIYSDNPSNTNINGDAVAAMNTISGSHSILSDVTNHLKIPPLSRETYYKIKCNSNSEDIPVMTPILETQCGNGVQTSIRERRPQSDHSGNVPFKPNNNQKKRKRITKKTQPPLERDFSEIDSNIVQAGSPHYINPPSTHPQNIETQVKSFPSGQLSLQRTKDPVPLSFGSNMFPQISRECPAAIISSESRSLQTIGRSPDQNLVPEQVPLLRIKDPSSLLSNTSMLSQNALHSGQMCSDSVSLQRLGGLREMPCPPLLITQNYIQPVIPTPAAVRCSENMPYKSENANDLYIKVPTLHDSLQREPMSSDPLTEFPNSTNQEESASDEQFSCASPVHISIPDAKISIKEEMEDHPIGESAYQSCER